MATFQYQAHRADQTLVEGNIDADDLKSARLSLESQGLLVSSIHQVEDAPPAAATPEQPAEAGQQALQRQIDRVLATGKPLAPALLAYAQELPRGKSRLRLQRLANQLEQGHDPSGELAAGQIDEEWIPLLVAAGSSSDPSQIPSRIIDEVQREGDLRGQFAGALAYPLVLFAVSAAVMLLITLWIIPPFHDIFREFDLELPAPTILVLTISEIVRHSGWVVLISGLLLGAILFYVPAFRGWIIRIRDWITQRIPVLGATVRLVDRARFTRCLANLLEAEVPATDALRISGRNARQTELGREANHLATEMSSGNTVPRDSPPFYRSLPHTVVYALQLQANPRAVALILRELSWMYDQQTRSRLAWIPNFAEPALIVFLGTAVGFYVVALFMPMVKLIENLS
jgi:type II secretory pathway component PulF